MGDPSSVEAFYESHKQIYSYLLEVEEVSFATDISVTFNRSLILAIASYFEHEITEILREIPIKHAAANAYIAAMVEKQVIARKYHTYFDWDKLSANTFFSLFGDEYKKAAKLQQESNVELKNAIKDFLELGQIRNKLVHQNYVQFEVVKTPEELIAQFRSALKFSDFLRKSLSLL